MEDTCSVPSSSVKNTCAHCNSDPDRCKLHETTSEPFNENHIPDFKSGDNVPGSVQEIGQASAFDRKPSTVLYGLHNDPNVSMNMREICGQESIIAHNVINDDRSNTKPRCENEPSDIDFGSVESLRCSDFEGSVTNIHVMVDVTENKNIDANDEKGTTTEENLVRRNRAKEIGTQTEGMDPFTYDFNRILNGKYTDGNCQGKYFKETSSDGETVEIKNDESACVGGFGIKEYAGDETNITSEHLHSHCNDHFDVIDFGLTCPHFNIIMTEQNKRSDHHKTAIGNFIDTAFCEPNKESVIDSCDYLIPFRAEYTNTVKFKLDTESNEQQVESVQDKKRALKENNSILADREIGQHSECHPERIETHFEKNSHTPFVAAKDRLICGSIKNEIKTSQTCTSHVKFANKFDCLENCSNCLEVYSKEGKMAAENQNGTDKILIEAKAHCPIHPSSTVSKCKFDEKTFYTDRHSVTEIKLYKFQDCIQISSGDFSESIEHRNMPKTAFFPNCEDNDDNSIQGKCKWSTDKEVKENIIDATCKVTDGSCLRLADKVVNSCKEDIATCEKMHTCETNMDGLKLESVVKISTKTNKHEDNNSLLHTVVTTSTKSESTHNSNEMEMGDDNFEYMRQLMGKLCVEDFQRTSSFQEHGRETNLTKNSRKESIKTYSKTNSRNNHIHDIKCAQDDAAYKTCEDRSHALPVRHVLVENREEACAQLINTVSERSLLEACLESHLPELNITEQTLNTMHLDESGVLSGEKLCVPGKRKVDHNFGPELGNSAECCTNLLEIPDITCATIDCTYFDVANGNLTNPSLHAANLVSDTCQSPQRAVYDTRKSMRHKINENVEESLANEIEASNNRCLNMIDSGVNKFANANTQGGLDPDVNFTENSDTATNVTDEITQQRVEILEHFVGKYENKHHLSLGCAHQENCISENDRTDINWEVVDVKQCTPSVAVADAVQRLAVPECECSFDDALNSTTDTDNVQCANGNDLIHEHLSGKTLRREGILVANAVDVSFENRSKDDEETHIGNANDEHVQIAVALEDLTIEDIRLQVVNEELSFHMNIHSVRNCQQSNCCSNSTNENVEIYDFSIANNVDEIHADIAGICGEVKSYETNTYKLCINGLQNDCSVITNNGPGISTSESFECNISTPIDSHEVQGNVSETDESVFDRNETTHIPASEMGGLHAYLPDMLEETSVKVADDYNVLSRQIDVETRNIECESLTVDRSGMTSCAVNSNTFVESPEPLLMIIRIYDGQQVSSLSTALPNDSFREGPNVSVGSICLDAEIYTDDPIISLSSNLTAPTVDLHPSRNSGILPVVNLSHDHWATTVSYDNPTDEPPMASLVSQYSGITVNLHPGRNRFLRPVYHVARAPFNDNSTDGPIISLASGITVDLHPGLNRFLRPVDHVAQAPLNDNSPDGPIVSLASVTSQSLPLPSLLIGTYRWLGLDTSPDTNLCARLFKGMLEGGRRRGRQKPDG